MHPVVDPERWDRFLAGNEKGQFQQATGWARTKALDGWRVERIVEQDSERIVAGAQLLWKQTAVGRIGYVSKGPVIQSESEPEIDRALAAIRETARRLKLRAMIVQPPDRSLISAEKMVAHGFSRTPVESVIRSTAIIDVSAGVEACRQAMSRQVRREMRVAAERGVTVRPGGRDEAGRFFELMCYSSQRQSSSPNPGRAELLAALWDAFPGQIHLWFAMHADQVVAGLLAIGFNRRLTLWKKGWSAGLDKLPANTLLNGTAIEWAAREGFREVDFVGMELGNALTLLRGEPLSGEQLRTRDVFNLRFGAQPRLLPAARLYLPNPLLRCGHRWASHFEAIDRWLMRRLGRN